MCHIRKTTESRADNYVNSANEQQGWQTGSALLLARARRVGDVARAESTIETRPHCQRQGEVGLAHYGGIW